MVLERSVPLLQQEEEEFGPDKGIHGDTQRKQKLSKNDKQKRREDAEVTVVGVSFCHSSQGTRSKETRNSQTRDFNTTGNMEHRQGRHSRTNKH